MKCFKHGANDAVAVCAYCGRGLCPNCLQAPIGPRMVCSSACSDALLRSDTALESILQQSVRSARASAFYCYVCGGLSGAASLVAWFMLPSPFLILFTAGCAVTLILSGIWYGRAAKKHTE